MGEGLRCGNLITEEVDCRAFKVALQRVRILQRGKKLLSQRVALES